MDNWIARLPIAHSPKVIHSTAFFSPVNKTQFRRAIGHAEGACEQSIKNGNLVHRGMEATLGNNSRGSKYNNAPKFVPAGSFGPPVISALSEKHD